MRCSLCKAEEQIFKQTFDGHTICMSHFSRSWSNWYIKPWKCVSLWQTPWPHLTSDTDAFWNRYKGLVTHKSHHRFGAAAAVRRNKTSGGWVENSLGNITVRPSRVTESITRWQGVLPPAMAQLCTSALCCQGKREESGSAWDECVCQQRSALNQSLSTICLRRTLSLELQSKGSTWPHDELGQCHFGWFNSTKLGYIQSYQNSIHLGATQ